MSDQYQNFIEQSQAKSFDLEHRRTLKFNISQYDHSVVIGKEQYADLELAKQRASHIKTKVIDNLEKHLTDFETNFSKNGGKVIWAETGKEAVDEILKIMKSAKARSVVKGKSMTTEEIHINEELQKVDIEPIETDLGEYIVQLAGEAPYHIVTPAMHKSKEDVAALMYEKEGLPPNSTPEQITEHVRQVLRKKFTSAEVGITGANFIIADIGGIAVTENEGNALMTMTFPKVHIVVVGIEKMLPYMKDLDLFWSLLSTYGTGQNITVYNTILTGPKKSKEDDGPEEMYVVLLDNGRTDLLNQIEQRSALSCIRCGACLNGCPVYKAVGGHAYGSTYSGPIGSIITPHFKGMNEFKHLSYASSLCGKCTDVCPVKIDIHKLLLYNRNQAVQQKMTTRKERWSMFLWKKGMLRRRTMNKIGAGMKNFLLNVFFKSMWGSNREMPRVAPKSYNELWKERNESSSSLN